MNEKCPRSHHAPEGSISPPAPQRPLDGLGPHPSHPWITPLLPPAPQRPLHGLPVDRTQADALPGRRVGDHIVEVEVGVVSERDPDRDVAADGAAGDLMGGASEGGCDGDCAN